MPRTGGGARHLTLLSLAGKPSLLKRRPNHQVSFSVAPYRLARLDRGKLGENGEKPGPPAYVLRKIGLRKPMNSSKLWPVSFWRKEI